MTSDILTSILRKEEDLYVAEFPEVGTVSQGDSIEEALAYLSEATEFYLEEFPLVGRLWIFSVFQYANLQFSG